MLFISLTQLANLINIESLVGVDFQHPNDQGSKFLTVPLWRWREISLRNPLEKFVQIQILFV